MYPVGLFWGTSVGFFWGSAAKTSQAITMERLRLAWLLAVAFGGVCATLLINLVVKLWWRPLRTKRYFESQGVRGPPYKIFHGNTGEIALMLKQARSAPMSLCHDILPRVFPHYHAWAKSYGGTFLFWLGPIPRLVISEPEMIKEILASKFEHFRKPALTYQWAELFGDGLVTSGGAKWVRQRRVIGPAFYMETLKEMVPVAVGSAGDMLNNWKEAIAGGSKEIDVFNEFRSLTADVIARTAFGSSYAEGKHIFDMQAEQIISASTSLQKVSIPGYRFLPTPDNLKGRKLSREIQASFRRLISQRRDDVKMGKAKNYGTDLLGLLMSADKESMPLQDIIDECKTFYAAGQDTTAISLTWTVLLLAMHTDWQERARREVLDVCKEDPPNADSLARLKIVSMILNESLRLYSPAAGLDREASEATKLGNLDLPAGTVITVPITMVHHDPQLWGKDATEFKPLRFADGISNAARHPMAFMPFGLGPRICVGQNFSLIEAKVVLAMILQRFSFVLSPAYAHAPATVITLKPQYGAQIKYDMLSPLRVCSRNPIYMLVYPYTEVRI